MRDSGANSFRMGDYYRICDRTGFKVRASRTRREWTGMIVRDKSYEERHPQDFVRGKRDDQTVPGPRPRQIDAYVGPLVTAVSVAANPGDQSISVDNTSRFLGGDHINIMLRTGDMHRAIVRTVDSATQLTLIAPLPYGVDVDATVSNITAASSAGVEL